MKTIRMIKRLAVGAALFWGLMLGSPVASAEIYMLVDGVDGDVAASGYPKWVEVDAVTESLAVALSTGTSRAAPMTAALSLVKRVDISSVPLRQKLATNAPIAFVDIAFLRAGASTLFEYFRIRLENVRLSSINMDAVGTATALAPTENVSLVFDRVIWTYTPMARDGSAGSPTQGGYDFTTNTPL